MRNDRGPARNISGLILGMALMLALTLSVPGCSGGGDSGPAELRVAAASSLQAVMPVLAAAFERETGMPVVPVLGSSGQLARQIEQGAPYDVFLSADLGYVRRLADSGAIEPGSVLPYAVGPMVLAFPRSAEDGRSGLESLADPEVRSIALANPEHAPYGRAARQALERSGLWERVESKVVYAQSVSNAAQFVKSGQVEVGLISRALADDGAIRWEPVDPGLYDPIEQYAGIVAGTPHREAAGAFCEVLLGDEGQGILQRFGFDRPAEARPAVP